MAKHCYSRSEALDILEHAKRHCVETMPLHTQKQARAYIAAMEDFQGAFWQIVREGQELAQKGIQNGKA